MRNRRWMALALLAAALLALGCKSRRDKIKAGPVEVISAAELYAKGQEALKKDRTAQARRYFDQIALREDAGEYKDLAAIATADAFYQEHTVTAYSEAISRYQSFLAFHPTHAKAAYCQYRIAQAYMEEILTPDRDTSSAKSSRISLEALIENYPQSPEAAEAKLKLKEVLDALAAHEIRVGDYYLKTGHPKGAIERYRGVLKDYPSYWNQPLLYSRLGEALFRDGQEQEALAYFTRIVQEEPGTELAKAAQKRIEKIQRHETGKGRLLGKEKELPEGPLVKPKKAKRWWQFWK